MIDRRRLRAALFIPVLTAVLAWPVSAAPPAGKSSHYPGQKCIECHKGPVRPGERGPAVPRPPAGSPAGTGTSSPGTTAPSQGAPRSR